jgi:hypothetical protein
MATFCAGLSGVGYIAKATSAAAVVVNILVKTAIDQGYKPIAPGKSYRWGKMSLSLWRQGHCKRFIYKNDNTIYSDELYMRPIFSGATDSSNINHNIQFWINKWGTENSLTSTIPIQGAKSLMAMSVLGNEMNSSTPFICDVCGNGLSILQPDALTFIPGYGDLTCSFIERAGKKGNITREQCPLVNQFLTPCGCNVLSPAKPQNPNIAPTPVNMPSSRKHRTRYPKVRD